MDTNVTQVSTENELIEINDDIHTMHRSTHVLNTLHSQIKLTENINNVRTHVCPHLSALLCVNGP